MCGIAGFWAPGLRDGDKVLRAMADALVHRGPDDEGYLRDGDVGLAVRRLSIIDVCGGHQPISSADGRCSIAFNGELYNFRELGNELRREGYRFATASDTEVVLAAYERDGRAALDTFNGMFGLAIWDAREQRLFLARDRLGIKPLYYFYDGGRFLFASEIKALLASGLVSRELNPRALWDYLTFRYVPQYETIWRHVHKLPAGHFLVIENPTATPQPQAYWDIPYELGSCEVSPQEAVEEFQALFTDAVRSHLVADVPVGLLLSGGIDSSAVAAAVAEAHVGPMHSFSVAFDGDGPHDERPFAREVASSLGCEHHEGVIDRREFCEFLPKLVHFTDEPLADLACVPLHYVSELARGAVKVVLSGEGSDEIFGGYNFDTIVRNWAILDRLQQLPLAASTLRRLQALPGEGWIRRAAGRLAPAPSERAASFSVGMTNYLDSAHKRRLWPDAPECPDSLAEAVRALRNPPSHRPLHQALYGYCQSWLVEDLLMKADRMTMASSIELRVPFLDHRLVEWAARRPEWVKVRRIGGRYVTKWVVREYSRRSVPARILARPKMGFPVPAYGWLADSLGGWASDTLLAPAAYVSRWFDGAVVREELRQACSAASWQHQARIWNLLILELWAREWKPA